MAVARAAANSRGEYTALEAAVAVTARNRH